MQLQDRIARSHHPINRPFLTMAPPSPDQIRRLLDVAPGALPSRGTLVLMLEPADLRLDTVRLLKSELQIDLFLDVTAVDWPERTPRFDVVYHFYSTAHFSRIRLKLPVPRRIRSWTR